MCQVSVSVDTQMDCVGLRCFELWPTGIARHGVDHRCCTDYTLLHSTRGALKLYELYCCRCFDERRRKKGNVVLHDIDRMQGSRTGLAPDSNICEGRCGIAGDKSSRANANLMMVS